MWVHEPLCATRSGRVVCLTGSAEAHPPKFQTSTQTTQNALWLRPLRYRTVMPVFDLGTGDRHQSTPRFGGAITCIQGVPSLNHPNNLDQGFPDSGTTTDLTAAQQRMRHWDRKPLRRLRCVTTLSASLPVNHIVWHWTRVRSPLLPSSLSTIYGCIFQGIMRAHSSDLPNLTCCVVLWSITGMRTDVFEPWTCRGPLMYVDTLWESLVGECTACAVNSASLSFACRLFLLETFEDPRVTTLHRIFTPPGGSRRASKPSYIGCQIGSIAPADLCSLPAIARSTTFVSDSVSPHLFCTVQCLMLACLKCIGRLDNCG